MFFRRKAKKNCPESVFLMFVMVKQSFDYSHLGKRSSLDIRYQVGYEIDT